MGYWIETDGYKKNTEFLKGRRNIKLINPFSYEERVKILTYRLKVSSKGYEFLVNFNAYSDGRIKAEIIDIFNKEAKQSLNILGDLFEFSHNEAETVYYDVIKVIRTYTRNIRTKK